jgi:hypothetical protein
MIFLPPFTYSIVVGLILSDGWLQKGKNNTNARLGFKQSIIHLSFALWIYSFLAHYCQSLPYSIKTTINGQVFYGISLQTRTYPCFTELYSIWYQNKVKILPLTIFEDLTLVALAIWAQGDGTKRNKGFLFCTHCFTIQQVVILINILIVKYGLDCTVYYDRKLPLIYIKPNSIILPYYLLLNLYRYFPPLCDHFLLRI